MLVLGARPRLVMQVLVLAVQNAVAYSQLGVATSAATLFRSIGGSLGTAIFGAIFANRLASELAKHLVGVKLPAGRYRRERQPGRTRRRSRRRRTTASSHSLPTRSRPSS